MQLFDCELSRLGIISIEYNLAGIPYIGSLLSHLLLKKRLLLLYGDLGSGKTEIARQILKNTLRNSEIIVSSPTFPIVNFYHCALGSFAHIDCYRLKSINELAEIGLEEILKENFCIIEWPELVHENFLTNKGFTLVKIMDGYDQDNRSIFIEVY